MKLVVRASHALVFALFAYICLTYPQLHAQQTLGAINGTVTDPSGAAISDAAITVVNNQTSLRRTARSQKNGYFEVLNLPIGSYKVSITHDGFRQTDFPNIDVQEARASTVPARLAIGERNESVTVNANPMLNATDTTNGYTLDKAQIDATPLATGSFTQLAILAPGTNAELLSGIGTNQGLGNQAVWANGQRDTDNTFTVNGVDVGNLYNGKSASEDTSQRYQFNIGEGHKTGGQTQDSTSVYGSNGNGLAAPPPEFMQEVHVATSMYDAQQGQTSGAHVDVNTSSGTNAFHGQLYGTRATNFINADPYFYKQDVGLGSLLPSQEDPQLHRWIAGGVFGGPIKKDKLFFFLGYQHLYDADQFGALSQLQVPSELTDDRSMTGIQNALCSYYAANGKSCTPIANPNPAAIAILQAKLPNGQYLIPSAISPGPTAAAQLAAGNYDATLLGTSVFKGDQAVAGIDYNATATDHLSAKYYYQHTPSSSPYSVSNVSGFPQGEDSGSQVASINNSISLGSRVNWEQQLGFSHQKVYSSFAPQLSASDVGISIPGGNSFPGIGFSDFGQATSESQSFSAGPASSFVDAGYFENRVSPSSNAIFALGNHTVSVGFNYNYNQLTIHNNDVGHAQLSFTNLPDFLKGTPHGGTVLLGNADRHYRSNEAGAYVMDKWQVRSNVTITAGLRYDFDGPLTEANGLMFNFDPSLYQASPAAITNSGFIVAGNNKQYGTPGVSDSTLKGRMWGIAPRIGLDWAPKVFNNKIVWRTGFGIYYDRGEYFQYLSPPAGQGISGPFGVTEEAPFAAYSNASGNLSAPFQSLTSPTTPASIAATLPSLDEQEQECTGANIYNGTDLSGYSCAAIPAIIGNYNIHNKLPYTENWTLDFQWQPRTDTSIDIGYVGNRGRHEIVPLPFNEPGIATPSNPINGQSYSYGDEILSPTTNAATGVPYIMASEPYDTYSGGNVDLRVPYVGYDPNSTSFTAAGTSAYDALQAHIEKRLTHGLQGGVSYTWSHTLDEQSDIGLFFTGDNPDNLRSSYADSDYDRTHVLTFNYLYNLPNAIKSKSNWLSYVVNDWSLLGLAVFQSGEPYSVYDYSGSVGSEYFGANISLLNPVLPLAPGIKPKQAETGYSGAQGQVNPNKAALNASDFQIPLLSPGQDGVPPCDTTTAGGNAGPGGGPLCDVYETGFVPGQRNIFRQAFQKRADLTFQKTVTFKDRYGLRYQFQIYNLTNTASFDIPTNNITLNPSYSELTSPPGGYANGTQVQPTGGSTVSTPTGSATCQGSSAACAYELYTAPKPGVSKLGYVTDTIGSSRIVEMSLHFTF